MIAHSGNFHRSRGRVRLWPNQELREFDGPTPFISFVHTRVSDVAGFEFAQFLICPKTDRPRDRSRSAMREHIWKRGVISIRKMATSPSQSLVSTLAAKTAL